MDVEPGRERKGMDGGVVHPYGDEWEGFLEEGRLWTEQTTPKAASRKGMNLPLCGRHVQDS